MMPFKKIQLLPMLSKYDVFMRFEAYSLDTFWNGRLRKKGQNVKHWEHCPSISVQFHDFFFLSQALLNLHEQ